MPAPVPVGEDDGDDEDVVRIIGKECCWPEDEDRDEEDEEEIVDAADEVAG